MSDDTPKIIVDSDWKEEAQKEKEELTEQADQAAADGPLPSATFLEVVNMISMQAIVGLGGMQTPDGKIIPPDLQVAKHYIDLLEVIQDKTKGNLDEQESKVLDATVHELRLGFVKVAGVGQAPEDPVQE